MWLIKTLQNHRSPTRVFIILMIDDSFVVISVHLSNNVCDQPDYGQLSGPIHLMKPKKDLFRRKENTNGSIPFRFGRGGCRLKCLISLIAVDHQMCSDDHSNSNAPVYSW